jgi:hypothetical protein
VSGRQTPAVLTASRTVCGTYTAGVEGRAIGLGFDLFTSGRKVDEPCGEPLQGDAPLLQRIER